MIVNETDIIHSLIKNLEAAFPQEYLITNNHSQTRILTDAIRRDERFKIKQHIREWYDAQIQK